MLACRAGVRRGNSFAAVVVAWALVSACTSDATVSFGPDPEPSRNVDSNGGESEPGTSGSSSAGATDSGGGATGGTDGAAAGTAAGGTSLEGGSSAGGKGNDSAGGGAGQAGTGGAGGAIASGGTAGNGGGGSAGASAGGGGDGGPCATGQLGGHLYAFCGRVGSRAVAEAKCTSLGMRLLAVQSRQENEYVLSKQGSTWLGATDEGSEGEWRWEDSETVFWDDEPVPGQYENFAEGQPNNKDKDGNAENCLALTSAGWNDVGCDLGDFTATCESTWTDPWPIPWPGL
jgi:Lectin C-type domain